MKPASHFSTLWGLSKQRLAVLLATGRIPGATQPDGHHWQIPDDAKRPDPLPGRQDYTKRKPPKAPPGHRTRYRNRIITKTVTETVTKIVTQTVRCKCCGIALKLGEYYFPIVDGQQDNTCPLCKNCNEEG